MNANYDEFLTALARNSAAAGVLVLLVLATQRVFRKELAPRWHCALWLLVVVRLLPFSLSSEASIFNLLPRWGAGPSIAAVAAPATPERTVTLPTDAATPGSFGGASTTESASAPGFEPMEEQARGLFANWTWTTVLFFGWLAGVVVLGGYVIAVSLTLARSLARLKPLDDPAVLDVLNDCCVRMGLRRAPVLMESDAVRTPALHGLARPRLLLPVDFTAMYSVAEQRFVFLHELAHLRRRDLLINWLMTGLQIVHWFNPLVWFGFARWRVDREIACDAAALEAAGAENNRAYGQTMLQLLQNLSTPNPRPGLVGILEDKRQLQRRMKMIAIFAPARRSFVAAGLLAILAIVGLTDAQVAPTLTPAFPRAGAATPAISPDPVAIPQPTGPYVLFLVNSSETMLGDFGTAAQPAETKALDQAVKGRTVEKGVTYSAKPRNGTDEQKRAAPQWQRTAQTLEQMLTALPAESNFQVALFSDDRVEAVGGRIDPSDRQAIPNTIARLRNVVPRGAANLESAFGFVRNDLNPLRPERIVLITDGLPTRSGSVPSDGDVDEGHRIKFFEVATKQLPPRIPVHTVLMPSPPGDPGAAGLFWELANATRGGLTCPGVPGIAPRTHLAFVIDTSGSMRDPNSGGLWPIVIDTIETVLDAHPQLTGVQLIDGDGRFILGRKGTGAAGWLANTPETRDAIKRVLRRYDLDTVSNPVPGINNAIRFLYDKDATDMRMGVYVLGDEFNSRDSAGTALDRVDSLNPRDANGRRPVTINAIGFPTTIRYQFSMGNTGLRFANLMRLLTYDHDGSFVALPDL